MKKFLTILLFAITVCSTAQQNWAIAGDTINMIDANGKRQGKWVILGKNNLNAGYQPDQIMSEGMYKDNRKTGVWIDYFPSGNIKNKMTYVDGRPSGSCNLYFWDGKVKEEGTWLNNRWVGNYKYTFENGDVLEMVFDDKGNELSRKLTPAKKDANPNKK